MLSPDLTAQVTLAVLVGNRRVTGSHVTLCLPIVKGFTSTFTAAFGADASRCGRADTRSVRSSSHSCETGSAGSDREPVVPHLLPRQNKHGDGKLKETKVRARSSVGRAMPF